MTVYKNLDIMNFQVVKKEASKKSEQYVYHFYFQNRKTKEIGIPLPDFLAKEKENYSEKYIETLICGVFDEYAKFYHLVENNYIKAVLTNKELKTITKALKNEYAKQVVDIINNTDNFYVSFEQKDDCFYALIKDEHANLINKKDDFEKNVRFEELNFLCQLNGFRHYEENVFINDDNTVSIQDIRDGFFNLGFCLT